MRFKAALFAAALPLLLAAVPATGQTDIRADPQKSFKHKPSGIALAAVAAGLPRASVVEYDDKQLDVAADFRTPDGKEVTTVYVFRNVTGDVPLWFDRIQRTVEARDTMANPKLIIPPAPFTPAGQSNPRALRAVYLPGRPPWTSSGAALTSVGDWYVAVRASSQTLTPEQLLGRIEQTFSAISWPREKTAAANAYLMADCPDALPQGPDAEPVKDDTSVIMMSALAGNVGDALKSAGQVSIPRWCRDPYKMTGAGIYRPDAAKDRFFVAFQDAGRGIMVGPNGLAGIIAGAKSDTPPNFMVEAIDIDRRSGFGSFKTIPSFAQAIWLNEHGPRLYSASTWGRDKIININSDAIK